jgi:phosphatidylglycerophosphatase A
LYFNKFVRTVLKNIATLSFIGYLPYAPGTWGSLAAVGFVIFVKLSVNAHLLVLVGGIVVGVMASHIAERLIGESDSRHIVIDEFIGYLVSVFSLPHSYGYLIAAFILFRFFDILKPLVISKLERTLSGGLGVMADDILAGIYTNAIIHIWIKIF